MAYVAPKVTVTGSGGSTFASSVVVATSPAVSGGNMSCTGIPTNAVYYNGLTSYSPATLSGSATASYTVTGTITVNTCQYNCAGGYAWNGTNSCVVAPAYSSLTTYTVGQIFSYNGATVTVSATGMGTSSTTITGCNTPDTVVWQGGTNNIQIWATCNMGATTAYTNQTYPSNTAPTAGQEAWMGAYYQWGNNADNTTTTTSGTQVNASGYGPGNYYNSATLITTGDWSSVQNDNLWGNTTNTSVARQGPCPTGYHVPSGGTSDTTTEFGTMYTVINSATPFGSCAQANIYDRTECVLKLPLTGDRLGASYNYQGTRGWYWSSSPSGTNASDAYFGISTGGITDITGRGNYALNVRCLRN